MTKPFNQNLTGLEGWIISFIIHGILAATFLVIVFNNQIEYSDYAQLTISNFEPEEIIPISQDMGSPIPEPSRAVVDQSPVTRSVDLPDRRMTEQDPERIFERNRTDMPIEESGRQISSAQDPLAGIARESAEVGTADIPENRPLRNYEESLVGDKVRSINPSEGSTGSINIEKPYTISFIGTEREVLFDPLPEYPPGVNKEVRIKIAITVLPDGSIGDMNVLQKGDATLESITMKTLKQWRLNPLEPSAVQKNQRAEVAFRFVLQ
jgi:protein TonB